jgi:hypothetical protein
MYRGQFVDTDNITWRDQRKHVQITNHMTYLQRQIKIQSWEWHRSMAEINCVKGIQSLHPFYMYRSKNTIYDFSITNMLKF